MEHESIENTDRRWILDNRFVCEVADRPFPVIFPRDILVQEEMAEGCTERFDRTRQLGGWDWSYICFGQVNTPGRELSLEIEGEGKLGASANRSSGLEFVDHAL